MRGRSRDMTGGAPSKTRCVREKGRAARRLSRVTELLASRELDVVKRLLLAQERLDLEAIVTAVDADGPADVPVEAPVVSPVRARAPLGETSSSRRPSSARRLAEVVALLDDPSLDVVKRLLLTQERLDLEGPPVDDSPAGDAQPRESVDEGALDAGPMPSENPSPQAPAVRTRRVPRSPRPTTGGGQKPLVTAARRAVPEREENLALAWAVHGDDPSAAASARAEMLLRNERLVRKVASRFRTRHLSPEDLVQEGLIGLNRAIDKFDPARGFAFSTYSMWWVRQAIRRAIDNAEHAIRVPGEAAGRHAAALEGGASGVSAVARARAPMVQLDRESDDGGPGVEVAAPDDGRMAAVEVRMALAGTLGGLEPFEIDLLLARFGVGYPAPLTLEVVAEVLGVSKERVRQLEIKALRRAKGADSPPARPPESFGDRPLEPALREAAARRLAEAAARAGAEVAGRSHAA